MTLKDDIKFNRNNTICDGKGICPVLSKAEMPCEYKQLDLYVKEDLSRECGHTTSEHFNFTNRCI